MEETPIERSLRWARAKGWNQTKLSEEVGVSPQDITNWKRRGMPADWYVPVAKALGRSVDELLGTIRVQESEISPTGVLMMSPGQVAQPMSLSPTKVALPITWEQLLKGEHAEQFIVTLPDDAMAPRAYAGTEIVFDTQKKPAFGDWVVVKDRAGEPFVRLYRQSQDDEWEAYAYNEGYRLLLPKRDGLKIIARMHSAVRSSL